MTIGNRIKSLREAHGMTQIELANIVGVTDKAVSTWENDINAPRMGAIQKMADYFHVSKGYLIGDDEDLQSHPLPFNLIPISDLYRQRVPLIGEVAAGEPIYAPEDMGVYVNSPVNCDAAITIHGDSMSPTYQDGDVVYIKCVPDVPEGAVAVIFLDDEAAIKHVYKRPTGLTLWSDNPNYMPKQIEFEDYTNVRIFGVPVGFTRIYKK